MHLHYTDSGVGRKFPALVTGKERVVANMGMITYGINKWTRIIPVPVRVRTKQRSSEWCDLRSCRGLVEGKLTFAPPGLSESDTDQAPSKPSLPIRSEAKKQRAQQIPEWEEKTGPSRETAE